MVDFHTRMVRLWLLAVAAVIFALVIVGGATRLTESGLSIVEWKPVLGAIPPLTEQAWTSEFEKYQAIPQYQQINRGMSLDEFKSIYWWEWAHRLLGRLVGFVFLLPFVWFLWKGWIPRELRGRFWLIFALGGLQGAVGWWMVSSGLADRVSVAPYRLGFHLTLACVIFAAILWTAQRLRAVAHPEVPSRITLSAMGLMVLVVIQLYLGALVAGLDAGLVYNTWPLIDGSVVPSADRLFFDTPLWRNLFENTLTVQFNHRMVAYLIWVLALLHVADVARTVGRGVALRGAVWLAAVITLQALLGIATLLLQVPILLALLHQATAVIVLSVAVIHAERLTTQRDAAFRIAQPTGKVSTGYR